MNKNKRQILILICLLTFIANYSAYTYYIAPEIGKVTALKEKYNQKVNKLNMLQKEKNSIEGLKKNVEELKVESEKLDAMAPRDIDTPKLIYDFYNFCRLYKVSGDTVKFQLQDGSTPQGANGTSDTNKNTNAANDASKSSSDNAGANSGLKLVSLTIDLSVSGNKKNVGNMINNLNSITDRTLNVKNIVLATADTQQNNGSNDNQNNLDSQYNTNNGASGSQQSAKNNSKTSLNLTYTVPLTSKNITRVKKIMIQNNGKLNDSGIIKSSNPTGSNPLDNELNENTGSSNSSNTSQTVPNKKTGSSGNSVTASNPDEMLADVIFVQYIQVSNDTYEKFKNYPFFDDTDKGFQNFSDMFK